MKITALFFALLIILSSCSASSGGGAQFVGRPTPSARFALMDGTPVALDAYHGKTVVVAFWATTCAKSKQMLEHLGRHAARFTHRPDVVFIAPSIDTADALDKVNERIAVVNSSKILFAFSGNEVYDEAYRIFEGEEIPYIIIVNPKGEVVAADVSGDVIDDALGKAS